MLRQCVSADQKNWVLKLPAVEFAINSARSESTGFAPFFLNSGRMPRPFIWDSGKPSEFAGVRNFAMRMKLAVMSAHDNIISARIKQVRNANRRRQRAPFAVGDYVYVSTQNMTLPKGISRKLAPKFVGPYLIVEDFGNNSFRINLPDSLKSRGIHNVFHSSLLRIHVPNDDRLFPGRTETQVLVENSEVDREWTAEKVLGHKGSGTGSVFEILWKAGDRSWLPYDHIAHLDIVKDYLEAKGVSSITRLTDGPDSAP